MSQKLIYATLITLEPNQGKKLANYRAGSIFKNLKVASEKNDLKESQLVDFVISGLRDGAPICSTTPHILAKQLRLINEGKKSTKQRDKEAEEKIQAEEKKIADDQKIADKKIADDKKLADKVKSDEEKKIANDKKIADKKIEDDKKAEEKKNEEQTPNTDSGNSGNDSQNEEQTPNTDGKEAPKE